MDAVSHYPFKDQPQIALMIDTLSRRQHHHLVMVSEHSEVINCAIIESLGRHLSTANLPKVLRESSLIYVDAPLDDLAELRQNHPRILIAMHFSEEMFVWVKSLALDEQLRFIIFVPPANQVKWGHDFSVLSLAKPATNDYLDLLKTLRQPLEEFHQVIFSDETFSSAYTMASHYLSSQLAFDKAIELLDSAAARASAQDYNEQVGHKPVVTSHLLAQIVSSWTQIPLAHLQHNKFQSNKFVEALRKQIFGQDAVITLIGSLLQNAGIKLNEKTGPLCSFLLVGSVGVGKTEMAYAMAEHLFGHKEALLRVNPNQGIKVAPSAERGHCRNLLDAVKRIPYAVILLENIEQFSRETLDFFKDILVLGYVLDTDGHKVDFRHTIFVMTTRFGAEQMNQFNAEETAEDAVKNMDLMQLVLNDPIQESSGHGAPSLSMHELRQEMLPKLEAHFSPALVQHTHVVPFSLLDYAALEKIVRLKMRLLARRLEQDLGIELNCTSDVVKFLSHEALWRKPASRSLDSVLEQHLYAGVTQEILAHADERNPAKHLLVQLNDSGQMLCCEFITSNEATLYKL